MNIYRQYEDSLKNQTPLINYEKIIDYYCEADSEYEGWSHNFNMHFGYCDNICDALNLEKILANMNEQVCQHLRLSDKVSNHLLDMGSGLGATARQLASKKAIEAVTGITLVAPQVLESQRLASPYQKDCTLTFALQDYHCTRFDDDMFEGTYALESGCHSAEADKQQLLTEAYRVIKPGSRFVMADGFIIGKKPLPPYFNTAMTKCATAGRWETSLKSKALSSEWMQSALKISR